MRRGVSRGEGRTFEKLLSVSASAEELLSSERHWPRRAISFPVVTNRRGRGFVQPTRPGRDASAKT